MKVTLISKVFPHPEKGVYPGLERHVEGYSKALVKKGIEVNLFTSFWNRGKEREEFEGIKIYRFPDVSQRFGKVASAFSLSLFSLGKNMLKCRDVLRSSDVVHVMNFLPLNIDLLKSDNVPIIYHFHHKHEIKRAADLVWVPLYPYLEKRRYSKSDAVITMSEEGKNTLIREYDLPADLIKVIPHGVDISYFPDHEGRKKFSELLKLLFVGNLEKRKGIDYLIKALGLVKEENDKFKLTIVGKDMGMKSYLEKLTNSLSLKRHVEFTNYVPNEELRKYYYNSDIFIFPSLKEGFGLPLIEAMACGLPIIATNTSSLPEVVGNAGILIEPKNPLALAKAIQKLSFDINLRFKLSEKAKERAKGFTWERSAEHTIKVYKEVAKPKW